MPNGRETYHIYDGKAELLSGRLELPLSQEIQPQAWVSLPPEGGYLAVRSEKYRLGEAISWRSAYTQVAGKEEAAETGRAWVTVATSVIERLNVMQVVTADRVVAQASTEHLRPTENGRTEYVPKITFLGTRFENLRIAGHPVHFRMNPQILGPRPEGDASYTRDPGFRQRVAGQYDEIRRQQNVPEKILQRYNQLPQNSQTNVGGRESMECSLITDAQITHPQNTHGGGALPARCFGHVIDVPNFGRIYLATLRVEHSQWEGNTPKDTQFTLTMLEFELGCIAAGTAAAAKTIVNGQTKP